MSVLTTLFTVINIFFVWIFENFNFEQNFDLVEISPSQWIYYSRIKNNVLWTLSTGILKCIKMIKGSKEH
jgi:hypothetical protein